MPSLSPDKIVIHATGSVAAINAPNNKQSNTALDPKFFLLIKAVFTPIT